MPKTIIARFSLTLARAALLGVFMPGIEAWAQRSRAAPPPQGAPVNPMGPRLEAQLAALDRGGGSTGDPARDEQIRRYQEAATKQQTELDRGFLVAADLRSEEHTSELQSRQYLVCRLLLEKKKKQHRCTSASRQQRSACID